MTIRRATGRSAHRVALRRRDVEGAGHRLKFRAPRSTLDMLPPGFDAVTKPYWAEIWPASVATARALLRGPDLAGRHVVDLGCGLGVAGVAAGVRGARVTFADVEPEALEFAAEHAANNDLHAFEVLKFDWSHDQLPADCDLLIVCDVCYEFRFARPVAEQVLAAVAGGADAWVVDPERPTAEALFDRLADGPHVCELDVLETGWDGARHAFRRARLRRVDGRIEGAS